MNLSVGFLNAEVLIMQNLLSKDDTMPCFFFFFFFKRIATLLQTDPEHVKRNEKRTLSSVLSTQKRCPSGAASQIQRMASLQHFSFRDVSSFFFNR